MHCSIVQRVLCRGEKNKHKKHEKTVVPLQPFDVFYVWLVAENRYSS